MAFTSVPAILSEVANFILGSVSWYAKAAAIFFMARPFLITAINVWGLKNVARSLENTAEIQGRSLENAARSLENAAKVQGRSLENAAEIQGRSLENAAHILTHRQVYSADGTTMVGLRAGAARAPLSSLFYITHR